MDHPACVLEPAAIFTLSVASTRMGNESDGLHSCKPLEPIRYLRQGMTSEGSRIQWPPPRTGESRLYGEFNACSSSRAASLKSFSGSIPAVLFISVCSSWIVLFGAK
jgi:hypothetical protein